MNSIVLCKTFLALTAYFCAACLTTGSAKTLEVNASFRQTPEQGKEFPFPTIPATLTEPEARKSYLLTHYWDEKVKDAIDFSITTTKEENKQ